MSTEWLDKYWLEVAEFTFNKGLLNITLPSGAKIEAKLSGYRYLSSRMPIGRVCAFVIYGKGVGYEKLLDNEDKILAKGNYIENVYNILRERKSDDYRFWVNRNPTPHQRSLIEGARRWLDIKAVVCILPLPIYEVMFEHFHPDW